MPETRRAGLVEMDKVLAIGKMLRSSIVDGSQRAKSARSFLSSVNESLALGSTRPVRLPTPAKGDLARNEVFYGAVVSYLILFGGNSNAAAKRGKRSQVPIWRVRGGPCPAMADLYFLLGDKDQAFALLEKAYNEHDNMIVLLKIDPYFDSLRSDRRFTDLLRRVGFPQ